CAYGFAQADAFRHSTTPSMIFPRPSRNLSGSTTCLLATASVKESAAVAKDRAASFLSAPLLDPKSASMPWTIAGIKEIPRSNMARKFIGSPDLLVYRGGAEARSSEMDLKLSATPRLCGEKWSIG